ncbi:MAG: hypothetical protein ACTSQS_14120, partial [Promethearchaeota archaeon]
DELISDIQKSDDFEVLCINEKKNSEYHAYDIEIANKNKAGAFQVIITPYSARIFQLIDTNFIGVFPILDLIDFAQPNNTITIDNI